MTPKIPGLWPIHLKPKPDELLSSWIVRFAHAHRFKAESIVTLLFGYRRAVWNRDIDKFAPDDVLEAMGIATATPRERMLNTTLAGFAGYLSERVNVNGSSRWILPLGVFHRSRKRYGLMYCPECLSHESTRYFKRVWRLAWATVCVEHKCLLQDRCPHCEAPITPHRADMLFKHVMPDTKTIMKCAACGAPLSSAALQAAPESLITLQKWFEETLQQGHLSWDGNNSLYSHLLFDGVRALATSLRAKRATSRKAPANEMPLRQAFLEMMSIEDRRVVLLELADLLTDWPFSFEKHINEQGVRSSDLKGDWKELPYWFSRQLKQMTEIYAPITAVEVSAIWNVAQNNQSRVSASSASKLSGRYITNQHQGVKRHTVSNEDYELLIMSIDQRIAATADENARILLLRDKFMFVTGRVLGLTLRQLSGFTQDDFRLSSKTIPKARFYSLPMDVPQAHAWLVWYSKFIRPKLMPNEGEAAVFTGPISGHRMQDSYIGARFKAAVAGAGLRGNIPSYSAWLGFNFSV